MLTGLVVSWIAAAVGAVIALVFGFLWIRDVTRDMTAAPEPEPVSRTVADEPSSTSAAGAPRADEGPPGMPLPEEQEVEEVHTYPRSVFLEISTLGLGAAIGGLITLPVLGFAVLPSFTGEDIPDVDLGPVENFPEGQFVVATYMEDPAAGEISRRTAFIRNNGMLGDRASYTVLYSRCVHLGCPVQPSGPVDDEAKKEYKTVTITPAQPSGFVCPCHGGAYDNEGRRTAGPPVRSMDRFEFYVRDGNLWLGEPFSVGEVEGEAAEARMIRYGRAVPGVHVDGLSAWLYPIEVP